jgi:hypothetical protein
MNESRAGQNPFLVVLCIFASIAAFAFGGLWLKERSTKPKYAVSGFEKPTVKEVVKEVPVEKIIEIPKEVIKEVKVPAELSEPQKLAIDFADRYISAKTVESVHEAFYKLDSVRVEVQVSEGIEQVLSEDRVRNKFELILRKSGLKLDEDARAYVRVSVEGLWQKDQNFLVYTIKTELKEYVVIGRKGDFRRFPATLWFDGSYGFAGKKVAEEEVLGVVEELGETFANKFLAEKDKSK